MYFSRIVIAFAVAASALLPPPAQPLNKEYGFNHPPGVSQEFLDITAANTRVAQNHVKLQAPVRYPTAVHQLQKVNRLITQLDPLGVQTIIEDLSNFQNRFYNGSEPSTKASRWLYTKISQVITASSAPRVAVDYFTHVGWHQPSIIVSIPGRSAKTVVVGAHQDSITGCYQVSRDYAPGADDNASGVATLLEALRVLLQDPSVAQGQALNTLEFHFYAAEEVGLQGSHQVFDAYSTQAREVKAMLNQDMTGYTGYVSHSKPEVIGVLTDNVDPSLTSFYCTVPYADTACGYRCSDHASAHVHGFPAAMTFESKYGDHSKFIHSSLDRADTINVNHILQHVRLVIGFAYELGFAPLTTNNGNEYL
ncbi:hypothetical protein BDV38DRAFT_269007 [Aspergillus pseudotamarii]|uniref:Peptide hydrolase n=1 Tax=Aspergillus pseudotamarii TaxID=132259 RepID=A0A5N6T275_ASPPS|nr:uncharacterized protein BDV38DRAFT_269007 [Aspergillus pseudotamarii]KAE8140394.1 hypothetical protein BDV38DRAFT_269007 [Aspergillus pseudotamarii]